MKSYAYVTLSAVLLFTLFIAGQAAAQGNQTYNDAKRMYGQYKQNQAQIDSLNRSIASHEAAIRGMGRDIAAGAYGYGSFRAGDEYHADIAAHRAAIERDQRTLALLQRRQSIIEKSWERNHHISGYFGSLKDTHGRTIYDHKSRKDVNLMDFRMDSFRNPGPGRHPSGARSPSHTSGHRDPSSVTSHKSYPTSRSSHSSSRSSTASTGSKSSTGRDGSTRSGSTRGNTSRTSGSSGSSGGKHTMTLTPVN